MMPLLEILIGLGFLIIFYCFWAYCGRHSKPDEVKRLLGDVYSLRNSQNRKKQR